VHMELTNACEFDCVFCPGSMTTRRPARKDTGLARQVMTELRDEGICEKGTFHVMGEKIRSQRGAGSAAPLTSLFNVSLSNSALSSAPFALFLHAVSVKMHLYIRVRLVLLSGCIFSLSLNLWWGHSAQSVMSGMR